MSATLIHVKEKFGFFEWDKRLENPVNTARFTQEKLDLLAI